MKYYASGPFASLPIRQRTEFTIGYMGPPVHEGLDPAEVKQPAQKLGGRPRNDTTEIVIMAFRTFDQKGGATAKQIADLTSIPLRSVQRKIKELIPRRLIPAPTAGGYQLALKERAEWEKQRTES